jgi:hypothetical protein
MEEIIRHIHIETVVTHPDDKDIVMFITPAAYNAGGHKAILQDDETKEVYTNPSLRKFNTSQPLQVSVTEEGKLHARFYSPRNLSNVLIKMQLPQVSNEYFDLAYFDSIPDLFVVDDVSNCSSWLQETNSKVHKNAIKVSFLILLLFSR